MGERAATRVLILGANGQIGRELVAAAWPERFVVQGVSRNDFSLTDPLAVRSAITRWRPDVIVNAAAYTAVDRAESEAELANASNNLAVAMLAATAASLGANLLHFSTDYVFDGTSPGWYRETDEPHPVSVYGQTKLAGERHVLDYERGLVLRTSWVYGQHGTNFVKTMRRLATERDTISVVADQYGCPTSAGELAAGVVQLLIERTMPTGLFHLAAPDSATWFDVADEALRLAGRRDNIDLCPITTADYPTAATRPANSRLDSTAISAANGVRLAPWRLALADVSAQLDAYLAA